MAKKTSSKMNWLGIGILSALIGCVAFLMWDRFGTQHVICGIEEMDNATGLIKFICKRQ